MQSNRRYYEANVLVVPLGDSGASAFAQMTGLGLTGVRSLETELQPDGGAGPCRVVTADGDATATTLAEAVDDADVVVLLASELAEAPTGLIRGATAAARDAGDLVAAVTVGTTDTETSEAREALAVLRSEVDMLVSVRQPSLGAAFLDVVRGGRRETAGTLS